MIICSLPGIVIGRKLGAELLDGDVWLSVDARWHIYSAHCEDYEICIRSLAQAFLTPFFVGQSPRHSGNFEVIKRIDELRRIMLVAVALLPNQHGNYNIKSAYLIKDSDLEERRRPPPRVKIVLE